MSSLFGVLGLAREAIIAQQAGIDTTGQNIANASTPGYVRRDPILSTRLAGDSGGVEMNGYARRFDSFAFARVVDEQGKRGEASARSDALGVVEGLFGSAEANLGERISALFSAFSRLTANPSDPNVRGEVLTKSEALVEAFGALAGGLSQAREELASQAKAEAQAANAKLTELAALNGRIAEAKGIGDEAGDLRDRRDVLVRDLGESLGAHAIEDENGETTLFAAGVAVVSGSVASKLDVVVGATGDLRVQATRPGGSVVDVTAATNGGRLGGIVRAREQDVPSFVGALDTLAFDVASAVNAVHSTGVGLDAVSGRNLFDIPATKTGASFSIRLSADVAGHPERIAATDDPSKLPGGNDVAIALARLERTPLPSGLSPTESYARITADLGTRLASARNEADLRSDTVAQADAMNASTSGVSLDEEMVKLTQFQRAFEASTKVLRTVDQLLEGLMRDL